MLAIFHVGCFSLFSWCCFTCSWSLELLPMASWCFGILKVEKKIKKFISTTRPVSWLFTDKGNRRGLILDDLHCFIKWSASSITKWATGCRFGRFQHRRRRDADGAAYSSPEGPRRSTDRLGFQSGWSLAGFRRTGYFHSYLGLAIVNVINTPTS